MKTQFIILWTALGGISANAADQPPPPQIAIPAPTVSVTSVYVYEQKPISALPQLVSPQQAQAIIDKFKQGYTRIGSPRILIYVNRDLVDQKSGVRLAGRTERSESIRTKVDPNFKADPNAPAANPNNNSVTISSGGNSTVVGGIHGTSQANIPGRTDRTANDNTYQVNGRAEPTLADKQTVRDVERLFGRPLRMGGAGLVDQRVATQLMADKPLSNFIIPTEGEAARKDREALGKLADVVLEILISSRNILVSDVSGDRTYAVPDIQATAIRLSDSRIIGQASASDILGKDRYAGRIVTNFEVREITEATALALMEDMMLGVK
jgi:hypothetical protein